MADDSTPWNILMGFMGIPRPAPPPAKTETSAPDYVSNVFPPNITGGNLLAIPIARANPAIENVNTWQNGPPPSIVNGSSNWPGATVVRSLQDSAIASPAAARPASGSSASAPHQRVIKWDRLFWEAAQEVLLEEKRAVLMSAGR